MLGGEWGNGEAHGDFDMMQDLGFGADVGMAES